MGRLLSFQEVMDANGEYIVPTAWRDLGAAEAHRRASEMRVRNLQERRATMARLEKDPAGQRAEMESCAFDLVRWATRWGWLPNANERTVLPFLPFESQVRELLYPFYSDMLTPLNPIDPRGDLRHTIIDKPRYMGATFSYLTGFLWGCLFHQAWDNNAPCVFLLAADRKEHLYSKDDDETHFGRMNQILQALPKWMLPKPDARGHQYKYTAFKLAFSTNRAMIRGKAAKASFGRAQRARAALLDEEAHMADGRQTVVSAGDLTNVLIRVSSVNGMGNSFAQDMHDQGLKIRRVHLTHKDCPWYDAGWLAKQAESRSPAAFQQEIMVNYRATVGRCYWSPPWNDTLNIVKDVEILKKSPLYGLLDIGRADGTAMLWAQADYRLGQFNLLGMVFRPEAVLEYLIPFFLGRFPDVDKMGDKFPHQSDWHRGDQEFVAYLARLYNAAGPIQWVTGSDAAENRVHSDSLITKMRRQWGVNLRPVKPTDKLENIDRVRQMTPYIRVPEYAARATPGQYDRTGASPFTISDVFTQYRKKINQNTGEVLEAGLPVHDQYSNPADALQLWTMVLPMVIPKFSKGEREKGMGSNFLDKQRPAPEEAAQFAAAIYGGK